MSFKIFYILLIFVSAFACQKHIAATQNTDLTNNEGDDSEPVKITPAREFISDKNKEIAIDESFVNQNSLNINSFIIKKIKVKKIYKETSDTAEIIDAVLSKKNKPIARFAGAFYPLGNNMDFGLFPFFGGEKQLIIVDTSNRYERNWILSLTSDYKLLFDSGDYGIYQGDLSRIDFDADGNYEITLTKSEDCGFNFANAFVPSQRIIFKFDADKQKFQPASHKFPAFTLKDIDEKIKRFTEGKEKHFWDLLDITLTYIYAGEEAEAWKFFDDGFSAENWMLDKAENKQQVKKKIKSALCKDTIYEFIERDTGKNGCDRQSF